MREELEGCFFGAYLMEFDNSCGKSDLIAARSRLEGSQALKYIKKLSINRISGHYVMPSVWGLLLGSFFMQCSMHQLAKFFSLATC